MNYPRTVGRLVVLAFVMSGCGTRQQWRPATPELRLLWNAEERYAENVAVAQLVLTQLNKSGITTRLESVSNSVFYERLGAGNFQCALVKLYLDSVDSYGFLTDAYSKSGFRLSKYENSEFDRAYLAALFSPFSEKQHEGFMNAQSILMKDLPWVPLYSDSDQFLLATGAEQFHSNAYRDYDYRRVRRENIRVASNLDPATFDPALVHDVASKHIALQSYEGLVTINDKLQIVPALAESWEFSSTSNSLSFNLRKGVKFHGKFGDFEAGDVKASFERMLLQNSPYAYIFDHVKGVDEFKRRKAGHVSGFVVKSPTQFTIKLMEAFPNMLNWLLAPAAFILPADLPSNYDFRGGSAGTGPFVLTKWDGMAATLVANSSYWGKDEDGSALPRANSLSIQIMREASATLTAFQMGELDVLNVSPALYEEIFDSTGQAHVPYSRYKLKVVPLRDLEFLAFRMGVEPWGTDVALRRIVNDSIDRNSIASALVRGKVQVTHDILPDKK